MSIKVIVNGSRGKMGQTTVAALAKEADLELVAENNRGDDLAFNIQKHKADVVVDFTSAAVVFEQAQLIIKNNARPVIGTSGLTAEQIELLKKECTARSLGAIIAPNFSLAAVLMMRYARDAAIYLPNVEIIEFHHPEKKDAPSGTAIKTAEMMSHAALRTATRKEKENSLARGMPYKNTCIHSVRLPGIIARQIVIFGGLDETLTIQQESISRHSFMPGVILCCRKVMELDKLVYGLENIL